MSKDSGNTVNDANIMLAVYAPHKDLLKKYKGYDLEQLKSRFRSCQIIKNRYGDCDVEVALNFFGEINMFAELPKPDEIYDYEKYKSPDWIFEQNTDVKQDIKDDTTQNIETERLKSLNSFNFIL